MLIAWHQGDATALDRLAPLVYDELHALAQRHMRGERPDHTLRTTALITRRTRGSAARNGGGIGQALGELGSLLATADPSGAERRLTEALTLMAQAFPAEHPAWGGERRASARRRLTELYERRSDSAL